MVTVLYTGSPHCAFISRIHANSVLAVRQWKAEIRVRCLTFGAGIFFKILAHPVFKMRILREPKKITL